MLIDKNRCHNNNNLDNNNADDNRINKNNNIVCKHVLVNHNHNQRPQTLPRKINSNNNQNNNSNSCDVLLKSRCSFNEHHHHHHSNNNRLVTSSSSSPSSMIRSNNSNSNNNNGNVPPPSSLPPPSSSSNMTNQIVGPLEQCSINATMTIRRLLQLYELGEYREAANIISRLPYSTFRAVVLDLPVDVFVEAIPSSLPILDALYAKVFFSGRDLLAFGFKFLHPENVVSHMIKMFAICDVYSHSGSRESISICKKLLKVILIADPSLRKQLLIKKALIDRAVEGMGHHGLVGTSNDALMNLHEALKLEFERVIQQYKGAIAKIDELSLSTKTIKDGGPITRSLSQGPAPTFSSHQRLLSLKQEEIQDRLNKNRSLLCALEPCFRTNHSLQILLAILQKRIDYDKETLFQFGQLGKEYASSNTSGGCNGASSSNVSSSTASDNINNSSHHHQTTTASTQTTSIRNKSLLANQFEKDSVVAPVLMRFSHGCNQVLNLLKEIQHETGTETDEQQQLLTAQCPYSIPTNGSGNNHIVNAAADCTASSAVAVENLDKMTKSSPCCSSSNILENNNNNNNNINRNDPLVSNINNNTNSNNNNNITVTDDSSDISGYHSDSDMSPISTQSPLATNNRLIIGGNSAFNNNNNNPKTTIGTRNNFSSPISTTTSKELQDSCCSNNVSIMTGQPDGTTLLAGEVTVNCGSNIVDASSYQQPKNNTDKDSYLHHPRIQQHCTKTYSNSICRIEIDGKPATQPPPSSEEDQNKIRSLRQQLSIAQQRIEELENNQIKLQEKLTMQSKQLLTLSDAKNKFENLDQSQLTNGLIRYYEYLYSQVRVDVIDALDQFDELKDSSELKIKLLFSIVVLAHRSTEQTFKELYSDIEKLLQISTINIETVNSNNINNNVSIAATTTASSVVVNHKDLDRIYDNISCQIGQYLRITSAYFDLEPNVQNVCTQIWDTLFDYPCLEKCPQLIDFVSQCVRLCWSLHVQQNYFSMDIETKQFKNEWHIRSIDSDHTSNHIKSYVWPTLFQHGICVHKGVVIT